MEDLIKEYYPTAIINGGINYDELIKLLVDDVIDLKEQNEEKDYQILHLSKELDRISSRL